MKWNIYLASPATTSAWVAPLLPRGYGDPRLTLDTKSSPQDDSRVQYQPAGVITPAEILPSC